MQVRDFLEPTTIWSDKDTLGHVASTLTAGAPVFYQQHDGWHVVVARDVLGYPDTRRLIDLPSASVEPVSVRENLVDVLQRQPEWEYLPAHDDGEVVGYVTRRQLVNPVTERYEADALTASLVRPLMHDMSNLLTIALAALEPALWGSKGVAEQEQARQALLHAASLITRAQDIASAKLDDEPVTVELNGLLKEIAVLLSAAAGAAQLDLRHHPGELLVRASRRVVTRALLNLVLNATQALEGMGTIRITTGLAEGELGCYRLTVEDDGPGIDEAVWSTLFGAGVSTHGAGRGLGLFGTRRALARVGARIQLCSTPLGGAGFEILLRAT